MRDVCGNLVTDATHTFVGDASALWYLYYVRIRVYREDIFQRDRKSKSGGGEEGLYF